MPTKRPIPKGFLTIAQASEYLGISRISIYNWIKDGLLESVKKDGRVLFDKEKLRDVKRRMPDE